MATTQKMATNVNRNLYSFIGSGVSPYEETGKSSFDFISDEIMEKIMGVTKVISFGGATFFFAYVYLFLLTKLEIGI